MWLLLLALPLQGLAAATLLQCSPSPSSLWHGAAGAQQGVSGQAAHPTHPHPGDMAAAGEHAGHSHALHGSSPLSKFKLKCSACAACCMGVALPSLPLVFVSAPPASAPTTGVATLHVDFVSKGLDRPPRSCAA